MQPGLIGERCRCNRKDATLVCWHATGPVVMYDHGTVASVGFDDLQFPPRTEQPDELREAAAELLDMLAADIDAGRIVVRDDAHTTDNRLRKALQ